MSKKLRAIPPKVSVPELKAEEVVDEEETRKHR